MTRARLRSLSGRAAPVALLLGLLACVEISRAKPLPSRPPAKDASSASSSQGAGHTPAPSVAAPFSPTADATVPQAVDWTQPEQAMSQFVRSLHERDAESLLQCFSRRKGFLLTGTADTPHDSARFSYAQLEKGLKPGGDFVGILFGGEGDDNFRDYVEQTGGRAWRMKQTGFFTPPIEHSLPVFVRWRREGKRFVVEEIAFPAG